MPLSIALIFHFSQPTHEKILAADRACYRGLLTVLRAHPRLKFNLHFGGTLLRGLNWLAPETLDLVRAGLADGQFELLGSTYAQNVLYACDDWDNARQIALHRAVLADLFGVHPTSFWNAGRAWRQSLVPLIAAAGYRLTLVEDLILRAGGVTEPMPVRLEYEGQTVGAVWDDLTLREHFNFAAWFGKHSQFFAYLRQQAQRANTRRMALAYAEDAQAMGMWNWELGYLPQAVWANLDQLLVELENFEQAEVCHLSSVRAVQPAGPLPDSASESMERALLDPEAPGYEPGYENWFQYLGQAPKLRYFRKLFTLMRTALQARSSAEPLAVADPALAPATEPAAAMTPAAAEGTPSAAAMTPAAAEGTPPAAAMTPAARPLPAVAPGAQDAAAQLYALAEESFCHHQFEFGRVGAGARGFWGWENVRSAFTLARAADVARDPQPGMWVEDVNADGSDEQMLCDGRSLAIFTACGGRLLYWFDLARGRQWVGNQLAVPLAAFDNAHGPQPPQAPPQPRLWLPDTFEADLRPWRAQRREESAPTRLGARLSRRLSRRGPEQLVVYRRRMRQPGSRPALPAQQGALLCRPTTPDLPSEPADLLLDYRFEPGGPCYLHFVAPGVQVEQRVRLEPGVVAARFTADNRTGAPCRLRLSVLSELAPDYAAAQRGGRAALAFTSDDDLMPGVVNTLTGAALRLQASRPWLEIHRAPHLLALGVELIFELELQPGQPADLEVRLILTRQR